MKIIIDTNRILAALIKDNTTRKILCNNKFKFIAPEYVTTEISKYQNEIIKKAKITEEEFEILLQVIFEYVTVIPHSDYQEYLQELKDEIKDPKDIPYLAACLANNAKGIWTHDPHFLKQEKVKIFTNINMLDIIRENN
jgi:predicted nucleic acid-binding protein